MNFSEVRAVYFDLDDTLCGYWTASSQALTETFETHRHSSIEPQAMMDHWSAAFREFMPEVKTDKWYQRYLESGEPTRTEQMARTLKRAGLEDAELAALMSETYMNVRGQRLALFHDALGVLNSLQGRYPLGLITNGPADIQRMEIDVLGIEEYFDNVFIEGEQKIGKPEQIVFQRAAKAVRLEPHQILFVGNSFGHDMIPAIEAGWRTAWIRKDSDIPPSSLSREQAKPEEKPAGAPDPDLIITDLSELLPLLTYTPA